MSRLAIHNLSVMKTLCVEESRDLSGAGFKIKPLGKFQQKTLAGAFGSVVGYGVGVAVTPFVGPLAAAAIGGAVSYGVGNHAQKKWTGKGLQNWNKPSRW